jgi:HlyD family secretion protein
VIAIVVLLAVGAGVWWWFLQRPAVPASWQGYVEADYIKVSPTQQGLLTVVSVVRGDAVAAGAPLFAQDDIADRAARDQAARQLGQAQGQLANLQAGGKPTEIRQAQAGLADARAALTRTEADYQRGQAVLPDGAISIQSLGQLRADEQSATAKAQAAEAALAQLHAPLGRIQEIKAQYATVEAARAALEAAEWRLAQRHVAAPTAGRIADVLARAGENVAAGAPVVSLLSPGNIFVRFFVPEQALATIHPGARVVLACDTCPLDQSAMVSFISPQAEYTPPLIYSDESRTKLVYLVEARPPPDQATRLNPGEPVAVRPMGSGATR